MSPRIRERYLVANGSGFDSLPINVRQLEAFGSLEGAHVRASGRGEQRGQERR